MEEINKYSEWLNFCFIYLVDKEIDDKLYNHIKNYYFVSKLSFMDVIEEDKKVNKNFIVIECDIIKCDNIKKKLMKLKIK